MVTVVLLVALRLGLGCHFLYEGVWKIKHQRRVHGRAVFDAGQGTRWRGCSTAMIPDLDGRQRLQADLKIEVGQERRGEKRRRKDKPLTDRWDAIRQEFLAAHQPGKQSGRQGERSAISRPWKRPPTRSTSNTRRTSSGT